MAAPSPRGSHRAATCLLALAVAGAPPAVRADEGPWPPHMLDQVVGENLSKRGLALSAEDLWNAEGGLMRAAVRFGGCSASFVSPRGLVATNHHCVYDTLQALSRVDRDLLRDGFLARSRGEELPAPGGTLRILRDSRDVSDRFRALLGEHTDPERLSRAADELGDKLVEACEAQPHAPACRLAVYGGGTSFRIEEYLELRDIRLVFAPPASVGAYGGEVDNWRWPRHTGDFALLRAYVGPDGRPAPHAAANVPYEPAQYLSVNAEGIRPGDLVAVVGYPGRTRRNIPVADVERLASQFYPARVDFYGRILEILKAHASRSHALALKTAARIKSLANRFKNAQGMLDGLRHNRILKRRWEEHRVRVEALASEKGPAYRRALDALADVAAEERKDFPARFLTGQASTVSPILAAAITIVKTARDRKAGTADPKALERARRRVARFLRNFDPDLDAELLAEWFARMDAVPELSTALPKALRKPDRIVRSPEVSDPIRALALLSAPPDRVLANRDPALAVAKALLAYTDAQEATRHRRKGIRMQAMPKYLELLEEVRGGRLYPDANGTLRISFATVRGYDPQDGLRALPQTRLTGAVEKHTGAPPFDLPDTVLEAAATAGETYWADPVLRDVPACFLTDADTTGGNSGSAVIDGRGRWVGQNFDRVWENVSGDFGYTEARSRNIVVDVRFLLWYLDDVVDAGHILEELGVARHRDAGRRPAPPKNTVALPPLLQEVTAAPPEPGSSGRGCACIATAAPCPPLGWLTVLLWTCPYRPRRRHRSYRRWPPRPHNSP